MHASTRANIVSTLVRAPLRIGFDRARARDQQWLFTNTKLPARRERHVMDGLFEFAELIGVQKPAQPRWDIPVGAADVAAVAPLFKKSNRTLVISPCTGQRFRNYRNWRADWYAQIADYAAQRYGAYVLVTGGNTEIEQSYGRDIAAAARFQVREHDRQDDAEAIARDPGARERRALPRLRPGPHGDGRRNARRRPLRRPRTAIARGPTSASTSSSTSTPRPWPPSSAGPIESLRWGQRVRDPAAMSLITVADVVAKLDAAFAERGIAPVR